MEVIGDRKRLFYDIEDDEEDQFVSWNRRFNVGKIAAMIVLILHCVTFYHGTLR